jgi:glycosyltransferase involved in cell wall biosynthesis
VNGKKLVLFLGRLHQKKGLELLIHAFARVADRCPDAHLVLAGNGDRRYMETVTQMVNECGVASRSTITGWLEDDDKLAALADADLFVLPSLGENFGIAVVEAMACGLPVVISDKVGIWQDVAESEAGIIVHCDSDEIASAIERLVGDSKLRTRLGRNGKNLAGAQFTMDRMAERMEIEYQALFVNAQRQDV